MIWRDLLLGDVLTLQRGFDITKAQQSEGPFPVVSSSGVNSYHSEFKCDGPGVVIGRKGTLGTAFFLEGAYWPHDTSLWVKDFKENDPRFCYYMLKSMGLEKYDVGSSNPTLNRNHLHLLETRVPPPNIQRRIADILYAYDDLIENNTRRIAILEDMARRLFEEWFAIAPEAQPPDGWIIGTVSAAATYINRGIAPKYDENGPSLVINQKCIRSYRLSLDPARRQSKPVSADKLVCPGDVLVNSTGVGTLGRVAQVFDVPPDTTVDTHVTIVRPRPDLNPVWFGLALLSKQTYFEDAGVGSTGQTELSRTRIADTELLIPTPEKAERFGAMVGPMRQETYSLERGNTNLRATRDLLLPKLISGQIKVRGAEEAMEAAAA